MPSEPTIARYLLTPADHEISSDVARALTLLGARPEPLRPEAVPDALPPDGGCLIIPPDLPDELKGRLFAELATLPEPWCFLLLEREEGELRALPVSAGFAGSPASIAERLEVSPLGFGYLSHRQLLRDVGRLRHDVNNALTSGMAEAQFLRMDAEDGSELAEGLGIVETQLDRIRALAESLVALRGPLP